MTNARRRSCMIGFASIMAIVLLSLLPVAGNWYHPQELLKQQVKRAYGIDMDSLKPDALAHLTDWLFGQPMYTMQQASSIPRWELPPGYQASNSGVRIIFAQVADGALPGTNRFYQTTFVLQNDSAYDVAGNIKLYDNSGAPLKLTIGAVTGSSIPIAVKRNQLRRFVTAGSGSLQVGWASIETDQPLMGTASFAIRDAYGKIYTDVGVGESHLNTSFTIFADSIGGSYTGLAMVNPSDTDSTTLRLELLDPKAAKITEATQKLGPREHVARFLNEYFPAVANINNFEGSVVVTSTDAKKFAGITLRMHGDQFTSLPMVPPPVANLAKTTLVFPQIADGLLGKLVYKTSVILFNNTTNRTTGKINFINQDGSPMNVTIAGKTAASFDYDLAPRAVTRLITSGAGNAKVGWSRVSVDNPISGAAIFHEFDAQGNALAEVGVNEAKSMTTFKLFADTTEIPGAKGYYFDTGIAIANTTENSYTTNVYFSLYDNNGQWAAQKKEAMKLAPASQQALFMSQMFPDYAKIKGFEGTIYVSSDYAVAPLTLRSVDEKLTSLPVVTQVRGFAPDTGIELGQNLAGTSPTMRWKIHLNDDDLAITSMKIMAPALKLQSSGLQVGSEIGYGTIVLGGDLTDSGVVKLLVSNINPLQFRAHSNFSILSAYKMNAIELFSGTISNSSTNGLIFDIAGMQVINTQSNAGVSTDLDITLLSDLIGAPASPGTSNVSVDYISSSGNSEYAEPKALRKSTQPIAFVAPDPVKANITSISPQLLTAGTRLTINGTNFGSKPVVLFPLDKNGTYGAYPITVSANSLSVLIPNGVVYGMLRIDNGSGSGNGYTAKVLFAPMLDLSFGTASGTDVPLTVTINQKLNELPVKSYEFNIFNVDRTLSGLTKDSPVGTYKVLQDYGTYVYTQTDYELRVGSSEADKAELYLAYKSDTADYNRGKITVSKLPEAGAGLNFAYTVNSISDIPSLLYYPTKIEIAFSGFPVKLPSSSDKSTGIAAKIRSGPAGLIGMSTSITVNIMK